MRKGWQSAFPLTDSHDSSDTASTAQCLLSVESRQRPRLR